MSSVPFSIAMSIGLLVVQPRSSQASLSAQAEQLPVPVRSESYSAATNDPSFKVDASLVNLDVLVADEDGRALSGLKRSNFRVLDNGSPQEILDFEPTSAPITIVLLMEYSGASYSYFAGKAANWGASFLSHLEPQDWIALVTFDLQPKVQVDFTHKQFEVRDAIAGLGFPGFREVNLYDALLDTLDQLDGVRGKKSILILATGQNSFSASNLDEVFRRLKETDTTIFCIGLAEAEYMQSGGTSISYMQDKNALTTFAKQTGGLALFPRFEGELPDIFRSVVGYLRNEYTLTFRPPIEARDGLYHKLHVRIVGPDGKPLKVTNEKGKRRKVEVFARQGYIAPKK